MITYQEALDLGNQYINRGYFNRTGESPLIISEQNTIEKPYGWFFFYNAKKFIETGNFSYALAGNGPILVDKMGEIHPTSTSRPLAFYIEKYDKEFEGKFEV